MPTPNATRIFAIAMWIAVLAMAGCAGQPQYRGDAYESRDLEEFLGFLREPGASRSKVEARIGTPKSIFEGGRIVMYGLWEAPPQTDRDRWGPQATQKMPPYTFDCRPVPVLALGCERSMVQLMIEYDPDHGVKRYKAIKPR